MDQLLLGRPCHEQPNGEASVVRAEASYPQASEELEVDSPAPLSQVFKYCSPISRPDGSLTELEQEPPREAGPNS